MSRKIPVLLFILLFGCSALTNYLELLALHKQDEVMISSFHIEADSNYSKTFEYIKKIDSKEIIVDCDLQSVQGFLNKALEKQMLTPEYHYHFTSLVIQPNLFLSNSISFTLAPATEEW